MPDRGALLGAGSSGSTPRWTEVFIFDAGDWGYEVEIVGRSTVKGERDLTTTRTHLTAQAVFDGLLHRGRMSRPALAALNEAAQHDADIAMACGSRTIMAP